MTSNESGGEVSQNNLAATDSASFFLEKEAVDDEKQPALDLSNAAATAAGTNVPSSEDDGKLSPQGSYIKETISGDAIKAIENAQGVGTSSVVGIPAARSLDHAESSDESDLEDAGVGIVLPVENSSITQSSLSEEVMAAASTVQVQQAALASRRHSDEAPLTFTQKMVEILSTDEYSSLICWLPHGTGFIIKDKKKFAEEVLPRHFKKSKFTSFTRKLNRWNFTRVTRGPEAGAYYHPLFQKGDVKLAMQIACINSKSPQLLQPMNPIPLGMGHYQPGAFGQALGNDGSDNSSGGGNQMVMLHGTNIGILDTTSKGSSETATDHSAGGTPLDPTDSNLRRQVLQQQLQLQQLQQKQQLQLQQQQAAQQQQLQHLEQQQALVSFQQLQSFNQQQQQGQQNTGQQNTTQQNIGQLVAGQYQQMNQQQINQQIGQQFGGQSNMVNQLQNFMFPFQQQQLNQFYLQQQFLQQNSMNQQQQQQNQSNENSMVMMNALSQQQQQYQNMFANQQQQMAAMSAAMDNQLQQQQQQLQVLKNQNTESTDSTTHQKQGEKAVSQQTSDAQSQQPPSGGQPG